MNWEITSEALPSSLSFRQKKELGRALEAMRAGDGSLAESILRPLTNEVPADVSVRYNLANSLLMQGRHDEGMTIIRDLTQKHPDYLFAQTHLARDLIREGDIEQAQRLLDPFLRRSRLHVSEFNALAVANIELSLAKNLSDGAQTWIPLMKAVDPANPQIKVLEELLEKHR